MSHILDNIPIKYFQKEIIRDGLTLDESHYLEYKLVNEEYINRLDTYNLQGGGFGILKLSDDVRLTKWNEVRKFINDINSLHTAITR